ncbi:Arm DNA-binding domain-containing protein [Pedobacter sp. MW01-1-1]|uniref:Arm DNA-binding domain-containing protein n=1 Tax=Pedobacter sp. MW01-1-1 TaxID=3383027 RepID=UPI003FEEF3AF
MKTNFSLLFFLKRPKNYKTGPAPIYLRITVEGKRSEFSSGRLCEPKLWNPSKGRTGNFGEIDHPIPF